MSIDKKSLEMLNAELMGIDAQKEKLRIQIEKAEQRELMPNIIKKFEGNYYKYENSGSGNEKSWWLYSHCIKMTSPEEGIFNTFQSHPYENTFKINSHEWIYLCQYKIRKTEYSKALKSFLQKANKLQK